MNQQWRRKLLRQQTVSVGDGVGSRMLMQGSPMRRLSLTIMGDCIASRCFCLLQQEIDSRQLCIYANPACGCARGDDSDICPGCVSVGLCTDMYSH